MTHHLTRFHTTNTHNTHIHLPLPSLPSSQSPIALVAFVARHVIAVSVATMSQSEFLQEEYSKKYRLAANTAVLNVAIGDLVAARKNRRADGGKRLIKSNHSYKNVIASLQSVGVGITYDALMKRVARGR
jgi:hypothetical protein